jgi:hypothetical protein
MRCLLSSVGYQVIASVVLAVLVCGNLTCSHCESLLAETPEIERFARKTLNLLCTLLI